MERRHRGHPFNDDSEEENVDLIQMDTFKETCHVIFSSGDAEEDLSPPSPIFRTPRSGRNHRHGPPDDVEQGLSLSPPSPIFRTPRSNRNHNRYDRRRLSSSMCEDGSLDMYSTASINRGFQDVHRQESTIHTRFDSDTVLLFNSPKKRRTNTRKKLLDVWCSGCLSHCCYYLRSCLTCNCACRDERGVHCCYKLRQKLMRQLLVVQGILCLLCVVLSFMIFLPLANVTADFDGECLLFADVHLSWIRKNESVSVDLSKTEFGTENQCNFTTFINVVVAIAGLFFIWFFINSRDMQTGPEQSDVRLHLPVFIIFFILLVSVIVSSFKITIGFNHWCNSMVFNNKFPYERKRLDCKDFEHLSWTPGKSKFYTYTVLAEISTWILTLTLFLQCCVTALRLYRNFKAWFEEIEIPHMRLDESSASSEASLSRRGSHDFLASLDDPLLPMNRYKVEYKTHQVMSQVVFHRDDSVADSLSPFSRAGPGTAIVVDAKKLKNSAMRQISGGKPRRKVDFPCNLKANRGRRRRNWTGSLEWDKAKDDDINPEKPIRSYEWHGFDNYSGSGDVFWTTHSLDSSFDDGDDDENVFDPEDVSFEIRRDLKGRTFDRAFKDKKVLVQNGRSIKWPSCDDIYVEHGKDHRVSHTAEWHGFESNFVSESHRSPSGSFRRSIRVNSTDRSSKFFTSSRPEFLSREFDLQGHKSVPRPKSLSWQKFDDKKTENFDWSPKAVSSESQVSDPWVVEGMDPSSGAAEVDLSNKHPWSDDGFDWNSVKEPRSIDTKGQGKAASEVDARGSKREESEKLSEAKR